MITRRKIMGYLAGMLGAGVTGAQAGLDLVPAVMPVDVAPKGSFRLVKEDLRWYIVAKLQELGSARPNTGFHMNAAICEILWRRDTTLMLLELPKPTYEHRVYIDAMTEEVVVMRPDKNGVYWQEDRGWKRLR
jgi:hypothetical protein